MIRLRRMLERGRRHPILGPIVIVLLVVLLAMVCLHAANDGWDSAAELGLVCIGLVTILGAAVVQRRVGRAPGSRPRPRSDRGPPAAGGAPAPLRHQPSRELTLPLRL